LTLRLHGCSDFLRSLLHWKPSFHPPLLAIGIVHHILVAHRRQFTGSVFTGMSMRVRAISDDLSVLARQQLWSKFPDLFGRDVQSSGEMGFSIAFRREGLNYHDSLLLIEFRFEVFGGNCVIHIDLLADAVFDARNYRLDSSHTTSRLM